MRHYQLLSWGRAECHLPRSDVRCADSVTASARRFLTGFDFSLVLYESTTSTARSSDTVGHDSARDTIGPSYPRMLYGCQ